MTTIGRPGTGIGGAIGATRFRRPASQLLLDAVFVPVFLVGFVTLLVTRTAREMGPLFEVGFLGGISVILALSLLETLRHGIRRDAIALGPTGIWLPETGWLRWEAVAEVRLEVLVNPRPATNVRPETRRLGIVPADPEIAARIPPVQRAWRLLWSYFSRFNPYTGGPPIELAPFGVMEAVVVGGLDPVVAAIRPHHEVVEVRGSMTRPA